MERDTTWTFKEYVGLRNNSIGQVGTSIAKTPRKQWNKTFYQRPTAETPDGNFELIREPIINRSLLPMAAAIWANSSAEISYL